MRFLSPRTIGSIIRPCTTLPVNQIPRVGRVGPVAQSAWASTSAAPDAASIPAETNAASETRETSETIGSEDPEELRLKAIKLYKELHRLGRDYPDPNYEFNKRLRRAFEKNSKTKDPAALMKQLELGEHIKKEVLALISLKKFRHLRRTYHANEAPR